MFSGNAKRVSSISALVSAAIISVSLAQSSVETKEMGDDGTTSVPAYDLPMSTALGEESRRAAIDQAKIYPDYFGVILKKDCPISLEQAKREELPAIRRCNAEAFKKTAWYKDALARFPAKIDSQRLGGVYTDVFTPPQGVSQQNLHRVLIHLHGGSMRYGAYWQGQTSAAPVAVQGRFKVVSVDYRQWPEATHPAALEDVLAVYKALLKDYRPENIGIFGCSAGGYLAGQSAAWIAHEKLPRPGAIVMSGGGISFGSDSAFFATSTPGFRDIDVEGIPLQVSAETLRRSAVPTTGYFKGANISDPLVFAGQSPQLLAKFPPTLLFTATRDQNMSPVLVTHARLVKAGVDAQLHVWEGLGHCFDTKHFIPEARDALDIQIAFFNRHLGNRKQ